MTEQEQIEEMAREILRNIGKHCEDVPFATMRDIDEECGLCTVNVLSCAVCKIARSLYATGYRKQAEGEHICCKDCKFSECCVVQIRAYNEEIDAELLSSDPNNFYCAFAKMKGGE